MTATKKAKLESSFEYYLENQDSFVEKYEGKFIVIKEKKVIGVYENEIDAYTETQKEHKLGTFLIQQVVPGKNNYTQTFHSQVAV